jgi:hypothetical protein
MLFTSSTGSIISLPDQIDTLASAGPAKEALKSSSEHLQKLVNMAPARTEGGFDVAIEEVPVTRQRIPFIQKAGDEKLESPGNRSNI